MILGVVLRIGVIVLGVYIFASAILSLAKRKMAEQFCLLWAGMAVLMVCMGIVLRPSEIGRYVSTSGIILIVLIMIGVLWGLWFISTQVSILMRKNQELAMQISLINRDVEFLLKEKERLEEKIKESEL